MKTIVSPGRFVVYVDGRGYLGLYETFLNHPHNASHFLTKELARKRLNEAVAIVDEYCKIIPAESINHNYTIHHSRNRMK